MAYKGFQRLNGTLRALAEVPSRAARSASARIAELVEEQFDAGADPYGRPWAPLTDTTLALRPWRGAPPLTDTGAMRSAITVRPTAPAGIVVELGDDGHGRPVPVATYHQTGTSKVRGWITSDVGMAQRQILPQSGGLAPAWRDAIRESIAEAFAEVRRG